MNRIGMLVFIAGMLAAGAAWSEIYRWTDANGKVHFADKPSVEHSSKTVKLRINTYESVSYKTSSVDVGRKVVMYSASWCGVCKRAKRYFQKQGIPFAEYDVEKSSKGKSEYRKLGARGVPVILVGNKRMDGFSVEGFEGLYR